MKGAGTSSDSHFYTFTDVHPYMDGVSYYRLRQIDFDMKEHMSGSVPVLFSYDKIEIIGSYAEPLSRNVKIFISSPAKLTGEYKLIDVLGNQIAEGSAELGRGVNTIPLDMHNSARGIYFLSLNCSENNFSAKLIY